MLLAVSIGALIVPATAGASNGIGGIGAGGVHACAVANSVGSSAIAPVTSITEYPGPPGPMAGPHSVINWSAAGPGVKNNGTGLIAFCTTK
jgi:hypothetical protein